jgi:hypothetical protein
MALTLCSSALYSSSRIWKLSLPPLGRYLMTPPLASARKAALSLMASMSPMSALMFSVETEMEPVVMSTLLTFWLPWETKR